ncbi:phospholipase effector Tle1 domain-containing protein, partial [Bradyrhizobium sp.]|uniref:phospholipase effector Tle1 domain-containing protein n=1 Tax=Bradyrhizobium sp. TaxID=376 RepID=UPI004037CE37
SATRPYRRIAGDHRKAVRPLRRYLRARVRTALLYRATPSQGTQSRRASESGVRTIGQERITQVWFAGVHANVGGGYPDDSMAYAPLKWMVDQVKHKIEFKLGPHAEPDALRQIVTCIDIHGRLYNSRSGLAAYYRYAPRNVTEICASKCAKWKSENSYFRAGKNKTTGSCICTDRASSNLRSGRQIRQNSCARAKSPGNTGSSELPFSASESRLESGTEKKIVYLAVVATTGLLFIFPFIASTASRLTYAAWSAQLSDIIRVLGAPTSYFTSFWSEAYARRPVTFLILLGSLLFSLSYHAKLKSSISDAMLEIWNRSSDGKLTSPNHNMLYRLRTNALLRGLRTSIASIFAPAIVIFLFLAFSLFSFSHLIFNFADSAGAYCKSSPNEQTPEWRSSQGDLLKIPAGEPFPFDALCWNSGIVLEPGRYSISLEAVDGLPLEPRATAVPIVKSLLLRLASPLKRSWARPSGRLVVRVGRFGYDENFLDLDLDAGNPSRYTETFRVSHKAPLFLYVNQPVLPLPGAETLLYPSSLKGRTATLSIMRARF